MKTWQSPWRSLRSAAVFAGASAVLVYLNALENDFAYDDVPIIAENPRIHSLQTLPEALTAPYWPGPLGKGLGLWRPATTGTFGLLWVLSDGTAVVYHLFNLLLHAAVTVLVVALAGALLPVSAAFCAGLLFAVHPVHVEAVANVVGMAELLSAMAYLGACLIVLRAPDRTPCSLLAGALALYALAFLAKESAVTLPGVVLLLDASRRDLDLKGLPRYLRLRAPLYAGMLTVAGLVLVARHQVLGHVARPFAPLGAHLLEEIPRIWTVAATWPHVFRLLFFPLDLSVEYGPAVVPLAFGWNGSNLLGLGLVLGALVTALAVWRTGPLGKDRASPRALGWGVVWFVLTLLPTSNLLFLSGILLSERTLYLPSVGFAVSMGWVFHRLAQTRPRSALVLGMTLLALGALRTWTRTPVWRNNLEVFDTLVREHPEAGRSQWILGDVLVQTGRVSEGLRAYRVAIGLLGGHYTLMVEVGKRLLEVGFDRAAEVLLRFAWQDWPEFSVAPALLAGLYDREGRYAEAEQVARAALHADSTLAMSHHVLSRALEAQGRLGEALEARWAAIRFGEGKHWQQWDWLASLELRRGDTLSARAALDSALARARLRPDRKWLEDRKRSLDSPGAPGSAP